MKLRIHSVLSGGAVDGPGLRTVIFTQGCPLSCKYCHNRDTWSPGSGKEVHVSGLVQKALSDKVYFGKRGGVTISGGDPLLQTEAVTELCKRLRENGIHVCLDTAGSVVNDKTDELLKQVDLVLLDVKHSDEIGFKSIAGGSLNNTLKFLEKVRNAGVKFWVRQVLVEGFTASKNQLDNLLNLLGYGKENDLNNPNFFPEKIELLPYHGRGVEKWNKVGANYEFKDMPDFDLKKSDALNAYIKAKISKYT